MKAEASLVDEEPFGRVLATFACQSSLHIIEHIISSLEYMFHNSFEAAICGALLLR